jgi:hypothetical protein
VLFILILLAYSANAQQFKLKNQKDNLPIQFAHINAINGSGTYSDQKGIFSIGADSVIITHINYKDTLILLSDLSENIIYLKPSQILLEEVKVSGNKKVDDSQISIYPEEKYKTTYMAINMSSFELGMVVKLKEFNQAQLTNVKIPVKLGKHPPLIKINVYELADNGRPSELIASKVFKDFSEKRKQLIETDFTSEEIRLSKNESIAISIELVGYQIDNEVSFQRYKRSIEALRIEMRLGNGEGVMRNKNQMMNWNKLTYEDNTPIEPAFEIEITDVE